MVIGYNEKVAKIKDVIMLDFKDICEENISEIKVLLRRSSSEGCEFTLGNILMWNLDHSLQYSVVEDEIVFRSITEKMAVYRSEERRVGKER